MVYSILIITDPQRPAYRINLSIKIREYLQALGHHVHVCSYNPNSFDEITRHSCQIMLTISFYPTISMLAAKLERDYFCWELDKIGNPNLLKPDFFTPYTFFFTACLMDTNILRHLSDQVFYLPASRDITLPMDYSLCKQESQFYGCDLSYIGEPLIKHNNPWLEFKNSMLYGPEETKATRTELLALAREALAAQEPYTLQCRYLLPTLVENLLKKTCLFGHISTESIISLLEKEACRFQRNSFLRIGSYTVDLYGSAEWSSVKGTHFNYKKPAEYSTEAGKIYMASKINLNITRIYADFSGYSNRVFNIVSSGGFLATTPIKGCQSIFEPGKECVVFSTPRELEELCDYYLNHDQERKEIALAGKARFCRDHTVGSRLDQMLAFYRNSIKPN